MNLKKTNFDLDLSCQRSAFISLLNSGASLKIFTSRSSIPQETTKIVMDKINKNYLKKVNLKNRYFNTLASITNFILRKTGKSTEYCGEQNTSVVPE